ncbi:PRC-barrel domain-containing protein [Geodermatophilus sp. SYSU D00700]
MLSERDLSAAIGSTAHGPDGEKIGTVESFFVDDRTGAPTWVAVSTGLFGTRHSIVPATEATFADGLLQVPVSKEAVKHAPSVGGDHLSPEEEAELRRHYGIGTGTGVGTGPGTGAPVPPASGVPAGGGAPAAAAPGATAPGTATPGAAGPAMSVVDPATRPVPPPATDVRTTTGQAAPPPHPQHAAPYADQHTTQHAAAHAGADVARQASDGAMTRSEEQLRVGTRQVATTRVRVVKYVVTEEVQVTVPIRREEIRIEEVPLDAPDPGPGESLVPAGAPGGTAGGAPGGVAGGMTGGMAGGLPEDIVLHAERPVVNVEVVPVERVRLRTELVEGQERITDQVQREQIVVDETSSPRTAPQASPQAAPQGYPQASPQVR